MIRRLLLFLVLVGAGIAALVFAIGGEDFANMQTPAKPATATQSPNTGAHLQAKDASGHQIDIGVQTRGYLQLSKVRAVTSGAGTVNVPVYELVAQDSNPIGDGLQLLVGVTMKLYDRGEHAANLVAKEAIVALDRDVSGRPSLREDKDVELHGADFTTVPGARVSPISLQVDTVKVLVRDSGLEMYTPSEDEPVHMQLGGDRPATLEGKGLKARMPKDAEGRVQRLDLEILHDPNVVATGFNVVATDKLDYVEDPKDGSALVTVTKDVAVRFDERSLGDSHGDSGNPPVTAYGDRLAAWLLRQKGGGAAGGKVDFRFLRLDGAPAKVLGMGVDLRCSTLTVVPGMDGKPYLFTGTGGAPHLVQTTDNGSGGGDFHASRRIHLVRPGNHVGAILRSFGFPAASLGALAQLEIAVFEGEADAKGEHDVSVHSSRGMLLLRPNPELPDGPVTMVGAGDVRIEQQDGADKFIAIGDDGFELHRTGAGDSLHETLTLGPPDLPAAAGHHFELHRGDDELHGTGACAFERDGKGATAVRLRSDQPTIGGHLRSNQPTIGGHLDSEPAELRAATSLSARFDGDQLHDLAADGERVVATFRRGDQLVEASGPRVRQEDSVTWRLEGDPGNEAAVERTVSPAGGAREVARLQGPIVRVYRVGQRRGVLAAERLGDRRVRVTGNTGNTSKQGGAAADLALDADRAQLLPFAIAPSALLAHVPMALPLANTAAFGLAEPWLFADGNVVFDVQQQGEASTAGTAAFLALGQTSHSGVLIGEPATRQPAVLTRTEPDGRSSVVRGPRVWMTHGSTDEIRVLTTFPGSEQAMLPELTQRDSQHTGKSHVLSNMHAVCGGEILVLAEKVLFFGPVVAHSLGDDGREDPEGMQIDAEHVVMTRDHDTHELVRVDASGKVTMDWGEMHAHASTLVLELPAHHITIEDPVDAELRLPNGRTVRAHRIEADYVTYEFTLWMGSVIQSPTTAPNKAR